MIDKLELNEAFVIKRVIGNTTYYFGGGTSLVYARKYTNKKSAERAIIHGTPKQHRSEFTIVKIRIHETV